MELPRELEPTRATHLDRDHPVVVLIRIRFADHSATSPGPVYNVVASLSGGASHPYQLWYVTGVGSGGEPWCRILDLVVRPGMGEPVSVDVYHLKPGERVE